MRAAQLFVEAANGRLLVAVHCGAQSTWDTVELAAHAAELGVAGVAVMPPPYFTLDESELFAHLAAAARACDPTAFYVYEFAARSGYAVPPAVLERLRDAAPNFRGLKVSDTPWESFRPYLIEGLDIFVGPESLLPQGLAGGAVGAVSALASAFPELVAAAVRGPADADLGPVRAALERFPFQAAAKFVVARRGVPLAAGRSPAVAHADGRGAEGARALARIVVAGSGSVGACIAYHLALLGATDVVLAERGQIASGSTGKAMGGVRQQFSTAAEVRLAQESIAFFEELGVEWFQQVGYLFVATTAEGRDELEARRELQAKLGVPVTRVDPSSVPGLRTDDILAAVFCPTDGVADPPALTREVVRRAVELGVELREHTDARGLERDILVIAAGAYSGEFGVDLPIRPLARQLLETEPIADLPDDLPMVIEAETGFHFRRRDDCLRIAMTDAVPRWGFEQIVDETVFGDRLERLAHRYPSAGETRIARAWAGLYDMTPDAHPIIGPVGDDLYAACGFSGHGFMQSPAVGRAVAEELLHGESALDLTPYRLTRFAEGTAFPEELVL